MTDLAVTPIVERPRSDDDSLDHMVCWRDADRAFCGLDVSDREFLADDAVGNICVVCADLCGYAPGRRPTCPHTGRPCNC